MLGWSDFAKKAQAPGYVPTPLYYSSMMPAETSKKIQKDWAPGGSLDSADKQFGLRMTKGSLKTVRDVLPGSLEGIAGIVGGRSAMDWTRQRIGDPFRTVLMNMGGRSLANAVNRTDAFLGRRAERNMSDEEKESWRNALDIGEFISNTGTDMVLSWPLFGKAIGKINKATGLAAKAINTSRIASKAPKVARIASKIPGAYVGYNMFGGPELVDAVKNIGSYLYDDYMARRELDAYAQSILEANGNNQAQIDELRDAGLFDLLPEQMRNALIEKERSWIR